MDEKIDEKRAKKKAYDTARYLAKKAEIDARNKAWNAANRDKKRDIDRRSEDRNKDVRREYKKQWLENNPDKAALYKERRELGMTAYNRAYRLTNLERLKQAHERWRTNNRDHVLAWQREWRAKNPERLAEKRAKHAIWVKANPHRILVRNANRRAAKLLRTPKWFGELDAFVVFEAQDLCLLRRELTGIDWHLDHMLPLRGESVSGLHVWNNIQVIPAKINLSKGAEMRFSSPNEWISAL